MVNIRLIQGDCLEEMQKLIDEDVKVDMVLTDPPYGTTACKWDTIIPFNEMWECINGLSYNSTPVLLFGTEPFSSSLRMSNIKNYRYDWIWYKNLPSGFPFAKYQPLRTNENISTFYCERPKYYPIKEARDMNDDSKKRIGYKVMCGGIGAGEVYGSDGDSKKKNELLSDLRYPTTIKKFNCVPNSKGRLHPSQKPIELLEYLIKTYTDEDDLVLDFTMGSGSTGVACKNLNRDFIGIELDTEYFKIAKERCKNYQSKLL